MGNDTFMYFAYGSNLLKRRIRINNPSAEFVGIGRLENHLLDFTKYSDHWRGTSATIVPTEGAHIWGAVWKLSNSDLPSLDKQEGVDTNWYFPKVVTIHTSEGSTIECRTYQQTINPPSTGDNVDIPLERRPSITYLNCILKGAIECQLPDYYIEKLKKIPHNGQEASAKMIENLRNYVYSSITLVPSDDKETFLYFAYGSNLLERRIHMYNPSAIFVTNGRLDNYRIDFIKCSRFWGGPTITIVPTANAHIWGAIWRLRKYDMVSLDDQKGVDMKKYYAKTVSINTSYIGEMKCRVYEQRVNPLPRGDNDVVPAEQWPSKNYIEIIILGAIERGLPEYYIEMLRKIKHNDQEGFLTMEELLRKFVASEPCTCPFPECIARKKMKLDLKKKRKLKDS